MDNLDTLFDSSLVAAQQPQWPGGASGEQVAKAVATLKKLPPLVFAGECDDLKAKIAEAASGNAFWLQGGDCAETFASATADSIRNRIKTILQMAAVLQIQSRQISVNFSVKAINQISNFPRSESVHALRT